MFIFIRYGRIRRCRTALSAPINKLGIHLKTKSFHKFNLLIPPQSLSHRMIPNSRYISFRNKYPK
ncbi:hypothetical protein B1H38_12275 [Leptospira borgpetersenii serovar Ballum]|nr:hypothetical protein B1H38_12275 [Leptospira borgpetersenii serovar Ballum]